jgi:hypothetical protein
MGRSARIAAVVVSLLALTGSGSLASGGGLRASIVAPTIQLAPWQSDTDNLRPLQGVVLYGGSPVSGVVVRVDAYVLPVRTDTHGQFTYLTDATLVARHVVTVADVTNARVRGTLLTPTARAALLAARGAIDVAYPITQVRVTRDASGRPVIEGRVGDTGGHAPPPVALYSYELAGRVTDSDGKPVVGARVSTRTVDRDYWTVSSPTDAQGRYRSLFTASSEQGGNPVPMTVRVSVGDLVYEYLPAEYVKFQRLESAQLDIRLPPRGYPVALPVPRTFPGALYDGFVIGVAVGDSVVRPAEVTWPDSAGRFKIVLPRTLAGRKVSLWEAKLQLFAQNPAAAGRPIDLRDWPAQVPAGAPRDLVSALLR